MKLGNKRQSITEAVVASGHWQAELFMDRIITAYDTTAPQMRVALNYKDAVKIHQACGAFLFFMAKLEQKAPGSDFPEMKRGLLSQFMSGFMDADLVNTLEEQIPSVADVASVRGFRRLHFFFVFF